MVSQVTALPSVLKQIVLISLHNLLAFYALVLEVERYCFCKLISLANVCSPYSGHGPVIGDLS